MNLIWLFPFILLSSTVEVPADNLSISQNGETIAVVNRSDFFLPVSLFPFFNEKGLDQLEDQVNQQIKKEPVNARLDRGGNIISEKPGVSLDRREFTEQFYRYLYGKGPATVEVPVQRIIPRVDSELISDIRTEVIGHYVTFYNSHNQERSHNISLATAAINNFVVFPGESFSFNRVVGKRTKEKGYMSAPIIVKGELSEGIGGGICQVSSTLYNAVDQSGLDVLERYSHSKRVPYVPEGRDATVSWYGPDFTFRNKYNQPILIRAHAGEGKMVVLILSSDRINYIPRKIRRMIGELPEETPAPS
ncbi:VanW family protein [Neobacillus sp. LXY-4]|uniref:VanW family protein n=1 Tax=Neobacillus sp. LXY-4 TaxID=3379826 RepID=UPI003EE40B92